MIDIVPSRDTIFSGYTLVDCFSPIMKGQTVISVGPIGNNI